jgi:hypothetical protein
MKFSLLIVLFAAIAFVGHAQDSTLKKEIQGKYKFPAGSVVEEVNVAEEGGMLTMSSAVGTSALEQVKGDTFNITSFSGIAVFKRNDQRKVVGVHIEASGYVLDGVKDSVATSTKMFAVAAPTSYEQVAALLAGPDLFRGSLVQLTRRRVDKGPLIQ